ncbi:iron chelate uptake ABC transporter family permease subunit [Jonesia quinghaiensis]|uniref:iron chelate uptake ABC transporter family permease subunit n=1 Tax=Jonesia quinghaiensis TaxID=262806 RepID=UPI00042820C4|nr:iron chelate uptake ABC transporter family permease subunit [Jonesia quinghaiensis]
MPNPARALDSPTSIISRRGLSPVAVTAILGVLAVTAVTVFLTLGLEGNISYILPRRITRVSAMVLVAIAVAVSTILFQTVTANRILTPSIMGFDALYILLQTVVVFLFGASTWLTTDPSLRFVLEIVLMVTFSVALYRWMFTGATASLHLMLLVGIVLGTLFRGFASLLQRLMDPSEYIVLQDLFFASFNLVDPMLVWISAGIVALCCAIAWRMRHTLDVMALGRSHAINLGINHHRVVMGVLVLCSLLVSVSTALVGPVTFFGLLVASLAYQMCRTFSHTWLLIITSLLGVITLVGGQLVLEHVFGFSTALSIVIEFVGGILFLTLLLKGSLR